MLKSKIAKVKLIPALFVLAIPIFVTSSASAATVNMQLSGTPRAATTQEITAMDGTIDASTTIPARGNIGDLSTTGWNVNTGLDLSSGKHELAVIQWAPLTIPACAASISVKVDTTIQRKAMDISTQVDSLEWGNALFRGSPSNPEAFAPVIIQEGRYRGPSFSGANPSGQDVPSNQAADYTISNDKSSINTTQLTREDLANGVFSFLYFDVYSPGPHNVSWFTKLNSATVSYEDSACSSNTPNPTTTTSSPAAPKTGAMAVAGIISIVILAGLVVTANILSNKMDLKKKSVR